jgi:hypothetical protein
MPYIETATAYKCEPIHEAVKLAFTGSARTVQHKTRGTWTLPSPTIALSSRAIRPRSPSKPRPMAYIIIRAGNGLAPGAAWVMPTAGTCRVAINTRARLEIVSKHPRCYQAKW